MVKIRVEGVAVEDPYVRYYGLGVDQDLNSDFGSTQPHKIRKTVADSFVDELDVPDATKFIVVGVTAYVGHWHVKVYADGKLVGEGNVAVPNAYPGSPGFLRVELPQPQIPQIPTWLVGLGVVAGACVLTLAVTKWLKWW